MNRERESIVGCGGLEVECEFLIEVFVFHYKVKDAHDQRTTTTTITFGWKKILDGCVLDWIMYINESDIFETSFVFK